MPGVVHRPDEGEALFGGRIVIKADFDEICITESLFPDARPGADPHFHRQHVDSFYVLEGELAVLVDDEEKPLSPGAFACAPQEVVHGFRSTSRARFLNFHTPDGGFARNLQERDRGEPGGFDSIDAAPGSGRTGSDAVFLSPGEGERLEGKNRIGTIKIGREELALIEWTPSTCSKESRSFSSTTSDFASERARTSPRRSESCTRFRTPAQAVHVSSTSTRRVAASMTICVECRAKWPSSST
jgi:mannose-6-phosphate isomerase-like protein (cupin superfamily)